MLLVLVVKNLVKMLQILSEEMPGLGQVYEDPPQHSKTFFQKILGKSNFVCVFMIICLFIFLKMCVLCRPTDQLVPPRRWGSFRQ